MIHFAIFKEVFINLVGWDGDMLLFTFRIGKT